MTRSAAAWGLLGAAVAAAGWLLGVAGLPSPLLFAALLVGLAAALWRAEPLRVPGSAFTAAQAVLGVVLGAYLERSSLEAVADAWLPVALVSAGILAASLGAGAILARRTAVDEPTGALGMVAGGASGIVAMAGELGADDRLVAFMQYLRVLVIVLLTPVLAAVAFGETQSVALPGEALLGDARDWLVTLAAAPAGAVAGRAARVPAGVLLGPMALAGALTLTGAAGEFSVPPLLRELAFVAIGLQVGLRFTMETVRVVGRLLVPVLVAIAGLIATCFGMAVALAAATPVTLLDAYLATTPGGLYAVLAVAFGASADTTFILAVQALRLLVMVLVAPLLVRRFARPASMRS